MGMYARRGLLHKQRQHEDKQINHRANALPFLWEKEIPREILRETKGKDKQRGSWRHGKCS